MNSLRIWKNSSLVGLYPIKEGTTWICRIRIEVGQWPSGAGGIPFFARGDASMATNTDIEIDDKRQLLLVICSFIFGVHGLIHSE